MGFFVCEGCNESLKKNKVDAHANRCRNCWAVACVDCSQVFEGDTYRNHVTCISEAEKYQGALYKGMKTKSTKVKAQDRWLDIVQSSSSSDARINNYLKRIGTFDNVPRNKKKFMNFLTNSIKLHDSTLKEKIWSLLDEAFTSSKEQDEATENLKKPTNGIDMDNKRKHSDLVDEIALDETSIETTANKKIKLSDYQRHWSKVIRHVLKEAPQGTMEIKKLRKLAVARLLSKSMDNANGKDMKKELRKEFKKQILLVRKVKLKSGIVTYSKNNSKS